eukprot:291254-Amphidinium_carterae.1
MNPSKTVTRPLVQRERVGHTASTLKDFVARMQGDMHNILRFNIRDGTCPLADLPLLALPRPSIATDAVSVGRVELIQDAVQCFGLCSRRRGCALLCLVVGWVQGKLKSHGSQGLMHGGSVVKKSASSMFHGGWTPGSVCAGRQIGWHPGQTISAFLEGLLLDPRLYKLGGQYTATDAGVGRAFPRGTLILLKGMTDQPQWSMLPCENELSVKLGCYVNCWAYGRISWRVETVC